MGLIIWLLVGALAGWIASKIVGTDSQQGWIGNIVMGVLGALVGGFLWNLISDAPETLELSFGSIIVAIIGAVILSFALGKLTGKRTLS
jgi:uncharacterized membrane protein YeaQ/YmgE (transglycosylase-associated protein family)